MCENDMIVQKKTLNYRRKTSGMVHCTKIFCKIQEQLNWGNKMKVIQCETFEMRHLEIDFVTTTEDVLTVVTCHSDTGQG